MKSSISKTKQNKSLFESLSIRLDQIEDRISGLDDKVVPLQQADEDGE
jgi:uncharacterized protein YdcH (DUF465 family)